MHYLDLRIGFHCHFSPIGRQGTICYGYQVSADWNVESLEWRRNADLPAIHIYLAPRLDAEPQRS
jgi:hypothetical protein